MLSREKWTLLEEDGLPARGKILHKSGFVYLYTSQIAIPRGGIICSKKPNKTNTQIGSGHFLCLSAYLFKKNTFLAPPDQTNTQKNSREQKKASHRDLCICVSVYRSKEITALGDEKVRNSLRQLESLRVTISHKLVKIWS